MTTPMTKYCRPTIKGKAVSEEELLRWEVERSRVALALLRRKLGVANLQALLKEETDESDREMQQSVRESHGKFTASSTELEVKGLKAEQFLAWFRERVQHNDQLAMGLACPEHYVVTPTDDGRLDVIETTGGYGLPDRFFVRLGEGASACPNPADIDPAYPQLWAGRAFLADGTEWGRVTHQFADTSDGFKAKLTIYFPEKAPTGLIEGHRWHLACEFTNWVNLCLDGLPGA